MKIFEKFIPEQKRSGLAAAILDFVTDVVVIFALVILIIKPFFFAPFRVQQQSMTPNVLDGEFIIVWKTPYLFGSNYERNDIVVFRPPNSDNYLIKRVIGLPGETIRFFEGYVWVENESGEFEKLDESFLAPENLGNTCLENFCNDLEKEKSFDIEVPEDSYFVMGDNRLGSRDSRSCFESSCNDPLDRFLPHDEIEGRAIVTFARYWHEGSKINFTIANTRVLGDPLAD